MLLKSGKWVQLERDLVEKKEYDYLYPTVTPFQERKPEELEEIENLHQKLQLELDVKIGKEFIEKYWKMSKHVKDDIEYDNSISNVVFPWSFKFPERNNGTWQPAFFKWVPDNNSSCPQKFRMYSPGDIKSCLFRKNVQFKFMQKSLAIGMRRYKFFL